MKTGNFLTLMVICFIIYLYHCITLCCVLLFTTMDAMQGPYDMYYQDWKLH